MLEGFLVGLVCGCLCVLLLIELTFMRPYRKLCESLRFYAEELDRLDLMRGQDAPGGRVGRLASGVRGPTAQGKASDEMTPHVSG